MKHLIIILSVFLLFSLNPLMIWAQDDEEIEMEEYIAPHEVYSFSYPAGWFVHDYLEEVGSPYVTLASTEALLEGEDDLLIPEGEVGLALAFFSIDLLAGLGLEDMDAEELTPDDIAMALLESITGDTSESSDTDEGAPVFGEYEVWELDEELDEETLIQVIPFTVESQEADGAFFAYEVAEDIYVWGTVVAHTGELAEYQTTILAILATLEVNVTAEELANLYLGGESDPMATEEAGN